ncbi:hypothetical protein ABZY58_11270 [Micromonospora tulbaghiae]|uniref:hypothetical protein n=1 Tax=Micromonospora tulbaghiae TaxID=479978 RepID=UPI0033AC4B9B
MARIWQTALGPLSTELRALGDLKVGDVFVGPDLRKVYKVTADAKSNPNWWVETTDLTCGPGEEPDGFWSYHRDTPMHFVVGGLPAGVAGS